jgi:hypothetical protein
MKFADSNIYRFAAVLSLILAATVAASAQITINIPKFPKIKKEKPQTSVQTETVDAARPAAERSAAPGAARNPCDKDPAAEIHLEDLEKTRKEAEEYRPGLRQFYVSTLSHGKNVYLEAALLPSVRKSFLDGRGNSDFTDCMNPALDKLAATARKTIATYTGPTNYTLGTPAEKKVLLSAINDLAQAKVIKVGILQPNWLIEKDSFNFPTARYRHGMAVLQYPNQEFCWVFWINIVQQYAGGGTYGASYGNYVARSLAGCPAAK